MRNVKALFAGRNREALHAAIAARGESAKALEAARVNAARLESVVAAYDDCETAAKAAVREEQAARSNAVRQGSAKFSVTRDLAALERKTAEAKRLAERAAYDAKIAREELSAISANVANAQHDLRNADAAIDRQVMLILLDEAEPTLRRFEKLAAEYRELHIQVRGLYDYAGFFSEGARRCTDAMQKARALVAELPTLQISTHGNMVNEPPPEVQALTEDWRQRAALLRANPDAE